MIKFGKGVVKCRFLILILAFLLLIPSVIGYMKTRINYDILSYLPGQIETMKGQDILLDEFGTGAFSFVVVEGMQDKDLQKIADKIEDVPHVKNVIWYGSVMDFSIPREALPDDIYNFFNNKDADSQLMAVLFDESMSSDGTMDAIQTINDLVGKQCFVSGMASVNNDIRKLAENESVIYVLIAVVLSLIVLSLTMDSVVVPVFDQYRHGNYLQSGFQRIFRGDFLYYQGTGGGTAARCYNGLFHFPVAQLSGAEGAV